MLPVAEFYEQNKGLVHAVSRKGFARFSGLGVSMDYEDIFQEMSVIFLKAYEGFDDSKGFKFTTYFYMSAFNRINSWLQKLADERVVHGVVSIEELNARSGGDGENNLSDLLMIDRATPETYCQLNQFITHADKSLSPLASLILSWCLSPPPELLEQLRKAEVHAEYGRKLGFETRCMSKLTPRYVGGFVSMLTGIPKIHIVEATQELSKLEHIDVKKYL